MNPVRLSSLAGRLTRGRLPVGRVGAAGVAGALGLVIVVGTAPAAKLPGWMAEIRFAEAFEAFPDADLVQARRVCILEVSADGASRREVLSAYCVRRGSDPEPATTVYWEAPHRRLRELKGWHRTAGGKVEETDRTVWTQVLGGELYSESGQRILAIENVGPGSLFGFRTAWEGDLPGVSTASWAATSSLPVLEWEFTLELPAGWEPQAFWVEEQGGPMVEAGPDSRVGNRWTWKRRAIAGAPSKREPWAPPSSEAIAVFHVAYGPVGRESPSWTEALAWWGPMSRDALRDDPSVVEAAAEICARAEAPRERASELAHFVRSAVGYVQVYLDDGGWRPHAVGEVLHNRFGDCKDMAHLLVALLRQSGLRAWPVLTNAAGEAGFRPELPSPRFDHCIVAVELPADGDSLSGAADTPASIPPPGVASGQVVFVDPTDRAVPFGWIPAPLEGRWALIVFDELDHALVRIPRSAPAANLRRVEVDLTIGEDLRMRGRVVERRRGQSAFSARRRLHPLSPEERRRRQEEAIALPAPGPKVLRFECRGLEEDGDSLAVEYEIEGIPEAVRAGDLVFLRPNRITAVQGALFPPGMRKEDVALLHAYREETTVRIRLPGAWAVAELPEDVEIDNEFGAFRAAWSAHGGEIVLKRAEEVRRERLPVENFELAREWADAMARADQQRITLRRGT